jgi:hypothetical protein
VSLGGIGTTAAQVFGAVIYRKTGEAYYNRLFWAATTLSITVSILAYYTDESKSAVNAKYSTAHYQALQSIQETFKKRVEALTKEKEDYLTGEYKRKRAKHYYTVAERELDKRKAQIKAAQAKLDKASEELLKYQSGQTESKTDQVTAIGIYSKFTKDSLVSVGAYAETRHNWFKTVMPLLMMIMFSVIPDLIGPKLFAYGVVGAVKRKKKLTLIDRYFNLIEFVKTLREGRYERVSEEVEEPEPEHIPTPNEEQQQITKLERRSVRDLNVNELKLLLSHSPNLVDSIPTLKGRYYVEASPNAGKTTFLQMMLQKAIENGEISPGKCILRIHDLKPFEPGKWPSWAEIKGSEYNIDEIVESLDEMHNWAKNKLQKLPVYIIQDEQLQISDAYLEKYKEPVGKKYTWALTFARDLNYSLAVATQLGTADADGTPGRATLRSRYDMHIFLIFDKIEDIRFAYVDLGYKKRFFNLPKQPKRCPFPVDKERHVPVKTPVKTPKNVVRLDGQKRAKKTTKTQPDWLDNYYNKATKFQISAIMEKHAAGESHNQIIKTVFACKPTPAKRKIVKAVIEKGNINESRKLRSS